MRFLILSLLAPVLNLTADTPLIIGNGEGVTVTGDLNCNASDKDDDLMKCACESNRSDHSLFDSLFSCMLF